MTWLSAWPSQFLPMYASWEAHLSLLTGTQVTCSQPVQAQTVGLASGRPLLPPWLLLWCGRPSGFFIFKGA